MEYKIYMIQKTIQELITYAQRAGLIEPEDSIVVRNGLMETLHVGEWPDELPPEEKMTGEAEMLWKGQVKGSEHPGKTSQDKAKAVDEILEELVMYACENKVIEDTTASREIFDTKLMGILTPFPREVIRRFYEYYTESPQKATGWYYDFCKKLNYVRAGRIARDKKWKYPAMCGTLDITINLSKPEKDPRDIAAMGTAASARYPKCQLCPENAGFAGNKNHPSRYNLRPIPVEIQGERWQLQYSPYGYYNEHCILFNERHTPMVIDAAVFEKLFDAVDRFPHYFFGSNADLPIVGGSILSHEHFQGGRYTFPIENAPLAQTLLMPDFPEVEAGIVKWYLSVIRLSCVDRAKLSAACARVLTKWREYSDESVGILAESAGKPHNTVTPIVRKKNGVYTCDLVLRNNRTTKERPLGIFHPNPLLHHIKKENIGLIEVMGLAILPSRLDRELDVLRDYMLTGKDMRDDPRTAAHAEWAEEILRRRMDFREESAERILQEEVGAVFEQVLSDAGVFQWNSRGGAEAFQRFVKTLM
ncbi:MAG: UDP-glucose--hexose-1-phosphate uridylyltransferase [Clostridiales bacterium]|nr:UDP-glucose--hexose-1-phosphate uridylyltransferase [Clostridiales bacterium]